MERVDSWTSELSKLDYEKSCGSRLADRCPHCSEVYRRDAFAVLRAGLQDAANSTTPFTFITFTTPGADVFRATHQRVTATSRKNKTHVRPFRCRVTHTDGDPLIGTPIDPAIHHQSGAEGI
jgi:hypothetical protein